MFQSALTKSRQATLPTLSLAERELLFKDLLAIHRKQMEGLTPLRIHIRVVNDPNTYCSTVSAIAQQLSSMNNSKFVAYLKGLAIHTFNAVHRGGSLCPFLKDTPLAASLHLGTTRVWNEDGSVNEIRLQQFISSASETYPAESSGIIRRSSLLAYLKKCAKNDPEDRKTGRHAERFGSRFTQELAATAAWDEVFNNLTCGQIAKKDKPNEKEPYISVEVIKEFFYDSGAAYLRAKLGLLPYAKQQLAASEQRAYVLKRVGLFACSVVLAPVVSISAATAGVAAASVLAAEQLSTQCRGKR